MKNPSPEIHILVHCTHNGVKCLFEFVLYFCKHILFCLLKAIHFVNLAVSSRSSVYEKKDFLTKSFQPSQSWHQLSVYKNKNLVQNCLHKEWNGFHFRYNFFYKHLAISWKNFGNWYFLNVSIKTLLLKKFGLFFWFWRVFKQTILKNKRKAIL